MHTLGFFGTFSVGVQETKMCRMQKGKKYRVQPGNIKVKLTESPLASSSLPQPPFLPSLLPASSSLLALLCIPQL